MVRRLTLLCLAREWGIKLVSTCALIYGGMYVFEWMSYRRPAQERKFKKQYTTHMRMELQRFSSHSSTLRRDDFREAFTRQLQHAASRLTEVCSRLRKEVADGKEELHSLLQGSETACRVSPALLLPITVLMLTRSFFFTAS